MRLYIGIDPGLEGAVVAVNQFGEVQFMYDCPIMTVGKKKPVYDVAAMRGILRDRDNVLVGLEHIWTRPGEGAVGACTLCRGVALWEGLLVGLGMPYTMVLPQAWKGEMMHGMPKEKDASRQRAAQLFPTAHPDLNLKKHHGRADALLIAEYMRRKAGKIGGTNAY